MSHGICYRCFKRQWPDYFLNCSCALVNLCVGSGSSGWQAPEQLRNERQTRAVDLFSLGCLLFFCITGGQHPFGESFERDINIVHDRKDLFLIENLPEATDLITSLLHPKPELRYSSFHFLKKFLCLCQASMMKAIYFFLGGVLQAKGNTGNLSSIILEFRNEALFPS